MLIEAVGGREHAHRRDGGVVVAGLAGNLAGHQPARGLEIHHEDLRFQQRGVTYVPSPVRSRL